MQNNYPPPPPTTHSMNCVTTFQCVCVCVWGGGYFVLFCSFFLESPPPPPPPAFAVLIRKAIIFSPAGCYIVDNIVSSVERSRKILMVFSRNFARSQWCQFELAMCLQHAMNTDDALVVVCLDDMMSRDLTPTMMAVFYTTTYIQWQDGAEARASFWGRLRLSLDELSPV